MRRTRARIRPKACPVCGGEDQTKCRTAYAGGQWPICNSLVCRDCFTRPVIHIHR